MERILCDWNELNNVQEIEIIKEYANIGRFITLVTTCEQYLLLNNSLAFYIRLF